MHGSRPRQIDGEVSGEDLLGIGSTPLGVELKSLVELVLSLMDGADIVQRSRKTHFVVDLSEESERLTVVFEGASVFILPLVDRADAGQGPSFTVSISDGAEKLEASVVELQCLVQVA